MQISYSRSSFVTYGSSPSGPATTFTPPTSSVEASLEIDRLGRAEARARASTLDPPYSTEQCVHETAPQVLRDIGLGINGHVEEQPSAVGGGGTAVGSGRAYRACPLPRERRVSGSSTASASTAA